MDGRMHSFSSEPVYSFQPEGSFPNGSYKQTGYFIECSCGFEEFVFFDNWAWDWELLMKQMREKSHRRILMKRALD